MNKTKIFAIVAIVACVALVISLVEVLHYSSVIKEQQQNIMILQTTVNNMTDALTNATNNAREQSLTIDNLTRENEDLRNQLDAANNMTKLLMEAINGDSAGNLKTIVVHVSEKGEGYEWGHTPNATYVYSQIRNQTTYDVLLLPEFEGNLNWSATYAWLLNNFTNIPIILPVFEGGGDLKPNLQLTLDEIEQATTTCNVKMVRLCEIISWYMGKSQSVPIDYIRDVLTFCRQHRLRVLWSEWKISNDAFQIWQNNIAGFEDIVTVAYQTNNEYDEPIVGYLKVKDVFLHWGASVQPWYWTDRYNVEPTNMPISLLIQHAITAKNLGAEMLQIEPYWYFFDNGEPKSEFNTLMMMVGGE